MQSPPASADATSVIILSLVFARPGASPRSMCWRTSSGRPRCRARVAGRSSPALATKRRSSKVIWIRSGWLRGSIYWVLLFRGRFFSGAVFLLQNHYPRSTGAPSCRLRTLTRRPPSVDSGLGKGEKRRLSIGALIRSRKEREEVVIDVDAKKPLSVVLSIRLDDEHLARLKGLAKQQDVGVTTLAKRLLKDSLVERERPPMPNADRLSSIVGRIGEAKGRDYGDGEDTYYVLSRAQLRRIEERLADASRKTLADAIEGSALAYGADMDDLLEAIRQIEM